MKINFIIDKQIQNNSSEIDINILNFLFRKIKEKVSISIVDSNNYKCELASINIFFNCVNDLLIDYAKYNILIPNQNEFSKSWCYTLHNFDLVLAKTNYIYDIFSKHISKNKISYISWRSTDIKNNYEKDYNEYLLFCYDSKYTDYSKIVELWKEDYPNLNIVNGKFFNLNKNQSNIIYHDSLSQINFENLYNKCGIHICLEECYNFNHNMNQCILAQSIPLIINSPLHDIYVDNEDTSTMIFDINSSKHKLKNFLGEKYIFEENNFETQINTIKNTHITILESMSNNLRKYGLKKQHQCDILFKELFSNIIKKVRELPKSKEYSNNDEDLPNISIMTLVHNRKNVFKLAIYNFNSIDYPKEKLEWVVYDSSNNEETVESLLPDKETREKLNIKYIHEENTNSIGANRNRAIEYCSNDYIAIMDDDDYYKPSNIKYRIKELLKNDVSIVGCNIMGVFDTNKYVSFIDSNKSYSLGARLSPASLCFKKEIINDKCKFCDSSIHECKSLINNIGIKNFKEICFENILVALNHKKNTGYRNVPNVKPNGNHFKFNEKLLDFIVKVLE